MTPPTAAASPETAIDRGAHILPWNDEPRYRNEPNRERRFALSADEIATYQRDGVLIMRGVFTPEEMQRISADVDNCLQRYDLLDRDNLRFDYLASPDGSAIPWKVDPFVDLSPLQGGLARDRRICDRLASLYDGYEPRLFKDKFIIKPAGGKGSPPHRDYTWWQGFPIHSLISVAVAVDGADRDNGCTELFPGSHAGYLPQEHALGDGPTIARADLEALGNPEPVLFECEPGDVAFFHSTVIHRAPDNKSDRDRRQIFFSYHDSRDGEHYLEHREHFWRYRTRRFDDEQMARTYFR